MDINIENMKANSNDREYVLKTVKEQGKMLEFASSELQDDEEVVKVALTQDGEALEFASDRLTNVLEAWLVIQALWAA